jgi:shikimate dehydrogenase
MLPEKKIYGLIGKNINYSFSKNYFTNKFIKLKSKNCSYTNFDLLNIAEFENIILKNNLNGLNVTIPYKEKIIPYLDSLDLEAKLIGAVNTIKIDSNKKLKGYNTDYIGFLNSIKIHLTKKHKKAIILGSGGASKAIIHALKKLEITSITVSRNNLKGNLTYNDLDREVFNSCQIIINCSPIGTYPKVNECPNIPYQYIDSRHICYDLIYNPEETQFLKKSRLNNAFVINGMKMLKLQAEESWKIWNS